jgi:hypothetical protein
MLKVVCDQCGEEMPEVLSQTLDYLGLATTDKWRVRLISNEIRDKYKGKDAATEEEKEAVIQLGHELIQLALYQPVFCKKCARKYVHEWDPKSGEPCPFELSPGEQRASFHLVKSGKNTEKE